MIRGPRRRGGVSPACLGHPCAPFDFVLSALPPFSSDDNPDSDAVDDADADAGDDVDVGDGEM